MKDNEVEVDVAVEVIEGRGEEVRVVMVQEMSWRRFSKRVRICGRDRC